jgi:CRISPR-associated protein Csm3
MCEVRFVGKYLITADIRCKTGLHIGAPPEETEIGGLDQPVIKDPLTGKPYIPGSSLKGKLRSLLEGVVICDTTKQLSCIQRQVDEQRTKKREELQKEKISEAEIEQRLEATIFSADPCSCGICDVCLIFGVAAGTENNKRPGSLIVRDAFPKEGMKETWESILGEGIYTEIKWENTIKRLTSDATPRPLERVPADSVFELEMVYDIYQSEDINRLQTVFQGLMLLEDSTLGGGGSRGSGKVCFENFKVVKRPLNYYLEPSICQIPIKLEAYTTATEIFRKFAEINWH